jgi:hypothetical protein
MVVVGKPEEMRPHRRSRHRQEANINVDIDQIRWGSMDWIHLTQELDLAKGCCEHCNEPSGFIKCREFLD